MAISEIAKAATEGATSVAENKPSKFELPKTQDVTEKPATGPEKFDAQEIRDKVGDVPNIKDGPDRFEAEDTRDKVGGVAAESEGKEHTERQGLTDTEKAKLKEDTGWSDEIIDSIGSLEEAEVYKKADLQEAEIEGKKCLIRKDLDMKQTDEFGRTNKERMENGQPPLTKNGEVVELHHIGQKQDSPLAELTTQEHRGKGNDTVLHDKQKESEIDRTEFKKERENHWENRAEG